MSEKKNSAYDKSDINRLLKALKHQEADRIPHMELWVTSQKVYEYVLGRKLDYNIHDASEGGQSITPEDDVEFASKLGQDAILCNFNWRPNNVFELASDGTRHYVNGSIKTISDFLFVLFDFFPFFLIFFYDKMAENVTKVSCLSQGNLLEFLI